MADYYKRPPHRLLKTGGGGENILRGILDEDLLPGGGTATVRVTEQTGLGWSESGRTVEALPGFTITVSINSGTEVLLVKFGSNWYVFVQQCGGA